jgi:hypothetical protein
MGYTMLWQKANADERLHKVNDVVFAFGPTIWEMFTKWVLLRILSSFFKRKIIIIIIIIIKVYETFLILTHFAGLNFGSILGLV